jgi:hypothetical protein
MEEDVSKAALALGTHVPGFPYFSGNLGGYARTNKTLKAPFNEPEAPSVGLSWPGPFYLVRYLPSALPGCV